MGDLSPRVFDVGDRASVLGARRRGPPRDVRFVPPLEWVFSPYQKVRLITRGFFEFWRSLGGGYSYCELVIRIAG